MTILRGACHVVAVVQLGKVMQQVKLRVPPVPGEVLDLMAGGRWTRWRHQGHRGGAVPRGKRVVVVVVLVVAVLVVAVLVTVLTVTVLIATVLIVVGASERVIVVAVCGVKGRRKVEENLGPGPGGARPTTAGVGRPGR